MMDILKYESEYTIVKRMYEQIFDLKNNTYTATTQDFEMLCAIFKNVYGVGLSNMVSCISCAKEIAKYCTKFIAEYEIALDEWEKEQRNKTKATTNKNKFLTK